MSIVDLRNRSSCGRRKRLFCTPERLTGYFLQQSDIITRQSSIVFLRLVRRGKLKVLGFVTV